MESEDALLLDCPKCGIMISVKVVDCRNSTEFPCPICSANIRFIFPPEDLDKLIDELRRKQERELKKAFRLSFGDI